jgi:hypothetical protein
MFYATLNETLQKKSPQNLPRNLFQQVIVFKQLVTHKIANKDGLPNAINYQPFYLDNFAE